MKHPNVIQTQQALPWHIGRIQSNHRNIGFKRNYDFLSDFNNYKKTKCLSVIASNKRNTTGHRRRVKYVNALKKYFGSDLDVFGRGYNEISDKWDAIAPYKYHIVLENSSYKHYWTEKLADSYLGGAFPFYYGCENILNYFDKSMLIEIDIRSVLKSIAIIEKSIETSTYEKSIYTLLKAKQLILQNYNIFPTIINIIKNYCNNRGERQLVVIRSQDNFRLKN